MTSFDPDMPIDARAFQLDDRERYDRRTVRLHWLTAVLVVSLWTLGQTIDWFPKGLPRSSARSTHIALGLLLAVVLVARIGWRATGGRRLPPIERGWAVAVAKWTHVLLYVGLCTTVGLGIANAWIRGDSLFGVIGFPAYDPANKALRTWVEDWHGLSANALLVVAGLHACAGLVHHFVLKDGVLRRMSSRRPA